MVAKDKEDNCQLAKVLEILSLLVKYGYYDDEEDVENVLKPLVGVMNGLTDNPFAPPSSQQHSGQLSDKL